MNHSKPKVYIVIYSLYHHVYKLSLAVREGLVAEGIDATIFQVQETLDDNVLRRMKAPVKPDIPVIRSQQLVEPDGLIFGLPTRFGSFPAQMKALLDATGMIWANGELQGKFAGTFFSTASQHGGHESLALTAITYLAHHGMMYVPFGFASKALFSNDEVIGGSAYGAGTITNGDGSRQPSEAELNIAKYQGQQFAKIVKNYARGRQICSSSAASSSVSGADPDASTKSLQGTSQKTSEKSSADPDASSKTVRGVMQQPKKAVAVNETGVTGALAGAAAGVAGAAGTAGAPKATKEVNASNPAASIPEDDEPVSSAHVDNPKAVASARAAEETARVVVTGLTPEGQPIKNDDAPVKQDLSEPTDTEIQNAQKGNPAVNEKPDQAVQRTAKQQQAQENKSSTKVRPEEPASSQPTLSKQQAATREKPKKSKKKLRNWFCCGSARDLD